MELEVLKGTRHNQTKWAGIDCAGLFLRSSSVAKSNLGQSIVMLGCAADNGSTCLYTIDSALGIANVGTRNINNDLSGEVYFPFDPPQLIHKGDIVKYKKHISIVTSKYSAINLVARSRKSQSDYIYDIIHAYGGNEEEEYTFPDTGITVFARKVVNTRNIPKSIGFGRIMLWD
jgi:hypothetical protein